MGSFFPALSPLAYGAVLACLLCRLLGHGHFCSLYPSVCSSGHNGTAPYNLYPRARPMISMRDGPAMQFSSRTPMAPAGANKCRFIPTPMLHPCLLQGGCACPLISTYLPSATVNLITTPLLPCLPLATIYHAAFCSLCVLHALLLPNHRLWME
jgi:hypothetical protein